jgi:hypothetical protein
MAAPDGAKFFLADSFLCNVKTKKVCILVFALFFGTVEVFK